MRYNRIIVVAHAVVRTTTSADNRFNIILIRRITIIIIIIITTCTCTYFASTVISHTVILRGTYCNWKINVRFVWRMKKSAGRSFTRGYRARVYLLKTAAVIYSRARARAIVIKTRRRCHGTSGRVFFLLPVFARNRRSERVKFASPWLDANVPPRTYE